MKAAELIDMVKTLGKVDPAITNGAILQVLNVAQEDIARTLRAPIATVDYTGIDAPGAFNWPADAREEGILAVYALTPNESGTITGSQEIPVFDFNTASKYDADWTLQTPAKVARYVVSDPTYLAAYPLLVPPPDSANLQSVRVTYVVRPDKMTELDDEPFSGRLLSFHDALAYRAAYLLSGSAQMAMEYERRMHEARGAGNHGIITVKNPLYSRTVVRSGRG